jgi:hypothetical protein
VAAGLWAMCDEAHIPGKRDLRKGRAPSKRTKSAAPKRRLSRGRRLRRALTTGRIDRRRIRALKNKALREAAKSSARLSILPLRRTTPRDPLERAFSAHPALDRRIALLAALSRRMGESHRAH